MAHKKFFMTALIVTSIGMSGCTTMKTAWSSTQDLFNGVTNGIAYGVTESFAFLRGSSKKSDISFAENIDAEADPETGVFKTAIGEYLPETPEADDVTETVSFDVEALDDEINETKSNDVKLVDIEFFETESQETEIFDVADITSDTVSLPIDSLAVPCPDGTYLAEDKTCMSLNNDDTDFARELEAQDVKLVIDTSPKPCPEGTYLNADNACTLLETDIIDVTLDTPSEITNTATSDLKITTPTEPSKVVSKDFKPVQTTECPDGFKLTGDNSCVYLGAEVKTKP